MLLLFIPSSTQVSESCSISSKLSTPSSSPPNQIFYIYLVFSSFAYNYLELYAISKYLASGRSFKELHYNYRIGRSIASEVVRKVCKSIWNRLKEICIPISDQEEVGGRQVPPLPPVTTPLQYRYLLLFINYLIVKVFILNYLDYQRMACRSKNKQFAVRDINILIITVIVQTFFKLILSSTDLSQILTIQ
ncbi:hypothetical protein QTP88_009271 [Uroleucon formosanum]